MSEPFGRYLINKHLPSGYRVTKAMSKGEFRNMMNVLAREDPQTYVRTISELKHRGDELSTTEGLSVGLDDSFDSLDSCASCESVGSTSDSLSFSCF